MKSFRKYVVWGVLAGSAIVLLRAELPFWTSDVVAGTALESALFRKMQLPDGAVMHLRPPSETQSQLTSLLEKAPHDAALYSIRAREEERAQNYLAAEADWRHALADSPDKFTASKELADFYRRRVRPEQEINTLLILGALPDEPQERFQTDVQQPQWAAFTRAVFAAQNALLAATQCETIYNAWIQRYPKNPLPYRAFLTWAIQRHDQQAASAIASRIRTAFPEDEQLIISTEANLAQVANGPNAALDVYARNFSPLWPADLRTEYYQALQNAHQLRSFLGDAQASAAANPTDLAPASQIFFYYEQQGRKDLADQRLLEFISRRSINPSSWNARDLTTVAELLLRVQDYDESAYIYYKLYEFPSASPADKERALASIISIVLDVPERPLHFANRDLSLYKNIAQMDPHPGFLNGILSLILNTTSPGFQYQIASQTAVPYFHRAAASRLIDKLQSEFPNSRQAPGLEAKLFSVYALYGQEDTLIRLVPAWLNANSNSSDYVSTALLLADAYLDKKNTNAELALYDGLLAELAAKSDHMPIGEAGELPNDPNSEKTAVIAARSPDYARVLDRYISRLVQLDRLTDALALFRREIDRNPDDPGIYQRLALFVEQNQLDNDLAQTYRQAFAHFKDLSWASKLARFYLRKRQYADYEALTRQITDTFKGSELERYLITVPPNSPSVYLQINLYAHERFPHDLAFVRNLLHAYTAKATANPAAYEALLRENWFNGADLRASYFEYLSRTNKLQAELAALPSPELALKQGDVAALELRAGAQAWLTKYEAAAPVFVQLAAIAPGDRSANARAISVERSLGTNSATAFHAAIRLAEQDVKAAPGDRTALTRVGEIYGDREMHSRARPWWNRVAAIQPGSPEGYLDSATVFWDYFQFADALRVISEARQKLGNPARFAYEAGAIYENQGKFSDAVASYVNAALHDNSEQAKERLLLLARRKQTAALVDSQTAALLSRQFTPDAFDLRIAILEKQDRRSEIQTILAALMPRLDKTGDIDELRSTASRLGFDDIAAQAYQRIVAVTNDPIEKIQARIDLARFYESHGNSTAAEHEFASLLTDEPNRLGVIRAAVDFYWRAKQPQEAVATLEAAANRAQAPYKTSLTREAADKATDSGQYQEARRLLDQLLANDPYNGDLLAEKASTYARQNDNTGLAAFYAAELKVMQNASFPPQDKTARIAALRRGYVLALIAVQQFTDALEQYQLILNAYPEDAALADEVSRFANAHQLSDRLVAYYTKAAADSSRDYRWPLVLAHVQTALRHYPEALAAYDRAVYVRPDRADLFIAKADLEKRLLRFENALKSYQKLYELSYHNVQYLASQAEIEARMGNKPEALHLLRAAYIDPHPHEPAGYVSAIEAANHWRMFDAADSYFRELRPLLSATSPWRDQALTDEVEALVALHRPADAISLLAEMVPNREQATPFEDALGRAVQQYLTPEEKAVLAAQTLPPVFHPVVFARAAGFCDVEAKQLVNIASSPTAPPQQWRALNLLQTSRLLFEEAGHQIEEIARAHSDSQNYESMMQAAYQDYLKAGDTAAQLRLINYSGADFPRLFVSGGGDLNSRITDLAGYDKDRANQVVEYLITNSSPDRAVQAIAARGVKLSSLWIQSYTALTGLYSLSFAPWVPEAFTAVLGARTVDAALRNINSNDVLHGPVWFYYAARYGDYLGYQKEATAEDFLPAPLEADPVASNSYVEVADSYRDLKEPARAAQLYRDALQLSPGRADVYDRLALLASTEGHRSDAIEDWRHALQVLANRVEGGPLPPDYWPTAQKVLEHMNQFHAVAELKPDADAMLRTYIRRNGSYQFEPFLAGILEHAPDRNAAIQWVIDLSRLPQMEEITGDVLRSDWVPDSDKDPLYRANIERARQTLHSTSGQEPEQASASDLRERMVDYARYLDAQKRWAEEWALLQQIEPATDRPADLLLEAGALTGHLDDLLNGYRSRPETAPAGDVTLQVASSVANVGHRDIALRIDEFEYERELDQSSPPASAWFGLARVRLEQKRNQDALNLIRNVTLTVGQPFENLSEAVDLLDRSGLKDDAASYALEWKTAEPWNEAAQLAYARLKNDTVLLETIRSSPGASYSTRVSAGRLLKNLAHPASGSDELSLLTHSVISPAQAAQPFFVEARLDAAAEAQNLADKLRLYREAIALQPELMAPRLDVAQAAFALKHDAFGLAAFESYNGTHSSDHYLAVEEMAAAALVRTQNLDAALGLYDDLLRNVKAPEKHADLQTLRDSAAARQALETANLARRPIVTDNLTQAVIVKPKLKSLPAGGVQ